MDKTKNLDDSADIGDSTIYSDIALNDIPEEARKKALCSKLVLSNNSLDTLPPNLGKVPGLTDLTIIHNNISDISEGIKKLNLSGNQISLVPKCIGSMSRLYSLSLSCNKISKISPEISELQNLRFLYLDNNNIKRVPRTIKNLTNMLILDLRNNPLEATDDSMEYGVESLSSIFGKALIVKDADILSNSDTGLLISLAHKRVFSMLKATLICLILLLLYLGTSVMSKYVSGNN